MDARSCKRCKKLFQFNGGKQICLACKKKEEEQFMIVKEYLRDNPVASMQKIFEDTKVPLKITEGFIKEGRLEVSKDSPLVRDCERCGNKSTTGRLCPKCKEKIANQINGANNEMLSRPKTTETKGMRSR